MTTEAPATLPPVKCAPWCKDGTGHTDAHHPDDQWCHTRSTDVHLSAEKLVEYDKGDWRLGYVSAYAHRDAYSTRPLIEVVHNDLAAMSLTVDEARELACTLLVLAGSVAVRA